VQKGKVITYGWFVVDIRPNKTETHQVRLTVGGNLIQYPGDMSTRSAYLTNSPKKPLSNGPLSCNTTVLKHVVSSVAEAEFGSLFVNDKEGTFTRTTVTEMGHNQDAT
jgi:hypothetical protein